ncbi:unnamed protein product [Caenorhabditis auriculariae]|uniref:Uncharacterized protein n=1 Tax=Caenorhabditis auriculariae TaxID=2777116 RepID=A0A8S1GUV8_9PELO|nr:unnamed protein product [Caenorhabditis auriculariae]
MEIPAQKTVRKRARVKKMEAQMRGVGGSGQQQNGDFSRRFRLAKPMARLTFLTLLAVIVASSVALENQNILRYENLETTTSPFRRALFDLQNLYNGTIILPKKELEQDYFHFRQRGKGNSDPEIKYSILLKDMEKVHREYRGLLDEAKDHVTRLVKLHEALLDSDDLFDYFEKQQYQQSERKSRRDEELFGFAVLRLNEHQLVLSPEMFAIGAVLVAVGISFSLLMLVYVILVLLIRIAIHICRFCCCKGRRQTFDVQRSFRKDVAVHAERSSQCWLLAWMWLHVLVIGTFLAQVPPVKALCSTCCGKTHDLSKCTLPTSGIVLTTCGSAKLELKSALCSTSTVKPCESSWGEWTKFTECTKDCGMCGTKYRNRTCSFDKGCPCLGSDSKTLVCNPNACDGTGPKCCGKYIYDEDSDSCVDPGTQPTSTTPCPSVWSEWSAVTVCTKNCGMCGTKYSNRTCVSAASGCPCTGTSSRVFSCNPQPCTGSRPCCDPFVYDDDSDSCVAGPTTLPPTTASVPTTSASGQGTSSTTPQPTASTLCVGSWAEWSDFSTCTDTCGMCGSQYRNRTCGPGSCVCEGFSSFNYECPSKKCPEPEQPCCFPFILDPASDACVMGPTTLEPSPTTGKSPSTTPLSGQGTASTTPQPTASTPCVGSWTEWSDFSTCTDTCGMCGSQYRNRTCGPGSCVCEGFSSFNYECPSKKCPEPDQPCCFPFILDPASDACVMGPTTLEPGATTGEPFSTTPSTGQGTGSTPSQSTASTACVGSWAEWSDFSTCTDTCGMCGSQYRNRTCGPGSCVCEGFSSFNYECPSKKCPEPEQPCCFPFILDPASDACVMGPTTIEPSPTTGKSPSTTPSSGQGTGSQKTTEAASTTPPAVSGSGSTPSQPTSPTECVGEWGEWTDVSACTDGCGMCGSQYRNRTCGPDSCFCEGWSSFNYECPPKKCQDPDQPCCFPYILDPDSDTCVMGPTTLGPRTTTGECVSSWGEWSATTCTNPCGMCGVQNKTRSCLRDKRGCPCKGDDKRTVVCTPIPCPDDQEPCCAPHIYDLSSDTCILPPSTTAKPPSTTPPCAFKWNEWSAFSKCTDTCGLCGSQYRNRTCATEPQCPCEGFESFNYPCGQAACPGDTPCCDDFVYDIETDSCRPSDDRATTIGMVTCESQWSDWSALSACTATCGMCGKMKKTRTCLSESNGCPCAGESTWSYSCNEVACPGTTPCCSPAVLNATTNSCDLSQPDPPNFFSTTPSCESSWSEWSAASACTASCGMCGTHYQNRTCTSAAAGCPCPGDPSKSYVCGAAPCTGTEKICCEPYVVCNFTQRCILPTTGPPSTTPCPGLWSQWTKYSSCTEDCGMCGSRYRNRTCTTTVVGCACYGLSADVVACAATPCGPQNRCCPPYEYDGETQTCSMPKSDKSLVFRAPLILRKTFVSRYEKSADPLPSFLDVVRTVFSVLLLAAPPLVQSNCYGCCGPDLDLTCCGMPKTEGEKVSCNSAIIEFYSPTTDLDECTSTPLFSSTLSLSTSLFPITTSSWLEPNDTTISSLSTVGDTFSSTTPTATVGTTSENEGSTVSNGVSIDPALTTPDGSGSTGTTPSGGISDGTTPNQGQTKDAGASTTDDGSGSTRTTLSGANSDGTTPNQGQTDNTGATDPNSGSTASIDFTEGSTLTTPAGGSTTEDNKAEETDFVTDATPPGPASTDMFTVAPTPPQCCPSQGIWSEWVPTAPCNDTCGSWGFNPVVRTCLSTSFGCPCTGKTSQLMRCNQNYCLFPRQTCCGECTKSILNKVFFCDFPKEVPLKEPPCCFGRENIWNQWSLYSACTESCGMCGLQTRTRTCAATPYGCDCVGSSTQTTPCGSAPCPGSNPCCPSFVLDSKTNTCKPAT